MLKSFDFNGIARGETYMASWSGTGRSKHLKVGRFFKDHVTTFKEDMIFFFLGSSDYGRSCLESK